MSNQNHIQCAQCGNSTSTAGVIPKFCSHCGARFDSTVDGIGQTDITKATPHDETIVPLSSAESIQAGNNLDETHDSSFVFQATGAANRKIQAGDDIGPFRLGCQLGSGGMGTVFEAHDTERDCPVALKLLSRQVRTTTEGVERFKRESQVAASINHPGSTFVYRSGQYGDQFFIAMELMNGGTLKDVVEDEGPLAVDRAVDFIIQAIDGLAVAHRVGIVHRDFKPSNCFVDDDGRAKVGDFGLAKNFFGDVALTQTGTFVGTPQFAAPEQLRAGHVDARTDIYAVGGSLFYLLTGRAPFVGDAAQVISGIAAETAPNIKTIAPHVPEKLAGLIASMLEKDPDKRPNNLDEIRAALLPFSSEGAVAPDTGRRMAAFFIDLFVFGFVSVLVSATMSPLAIIINPDLANFYILLVNFVLLLVWFTMQEYVSGTTIGKWLMNMRVVNEQNESPRLWQAAARSILIPGSRQLILLGSMLSLESAPNQGLDVENSLKIGFVQLLSVLSWIPCLLLMLTARITNGYRGIHDLLSKTRVVRFSGAIEAGTVEDVAVTAPAEFDVSSVSPASIEPFRVLGELGIHQATNSRILIGVDPELDRKVWIYETTEAEPPLSHAAIRPTRQRIIASKADTSCEPAKHYFVTESTEGMPLVQYIESADPVQWSTFRPILADLASELHLAESEGSLPSSLSTDHWWLDRSGQLKLIEMATTESTSDASPNEVFNQIMDRVIEHHPVPAHVIELHDRCRNEERSTMTEVAHRLDEIANVPSSWTWIDRMGATCVSLAVELSVLFLIGQAWLALCLTQFNLSVFSICAWLTGFLIVAAVMTGVFSESPSFWFLGIAVRKSNKRDTPSRLRLAARTVFSWLLPIVLVTSVVGMQAAAIDIKPGVFPVSIVVTGLTFAAVSLVMMLVAVFNLLRPSRGVADVLCGTLLMRK